MADVQNIRIKYVVDTTDLEKSDKALNNLNKEEKELIDNFRKVDAEAKKTNDTIQSESDKSAKAVDKTTKSTDNFSKGIQKVGGAIVAAFAVSSVINFTKEIISVTGEFQKLSAVLVNTLGSQSMAARALADIKAFAAETPFSVSELTASFVKLANQGFTPTTNELRKLGDLASSTGKSFDQLTEAIIDAQTGEFERLKEFGIRASKEGDNVAFTFKGVKTQTDFTNESIRAYILSLGDLEGVSGSMAAISETLEGKISNLGDSYESLLNTIGSGNDGILSDAIGLLSDLIKGLETALLTEDQISNRILQTAAKVKGTNILKFIDEDTKTLIDSQTKLNGVYLDTNTILRINIGDLERTIIEENQTIDVINKKIKALEAENDKYLYGDKKRTERIERLKAERFEEQKAIAGQQFAIDELNTRLKNNEKAEIAAGEAAKKAAEERAKASEKAFKDSLSNLGLEEQLAIRRAKLNDASEQEINQISQFYNDRRISLYQQYGKAVGVVYKGIVLRGEELEKELTQILAEEVQKRIEEERKFEVEYNKQKEANVNKAIEDTDNRLKYNLLRIRKEQSQNDEAIAMERAATIGAIEQKIIIEKEAGRETIDLELELQAQKDAIRNDELVKEKKATDEKKAIRKAEYDLSVSFVNSLFQINSNLIARDLQQLQQKQAYELQLAGDNANARAVIQNRYAKQEAELKTRQARSDKQAALFNIAINTAQAISKANPVVPLMIFAGATGALQLAAVASRPIPKYKKGTKSVPGVDTGQDSILAMLRPGEAVIPTEKAQNKQYAPIIAGMIDGTFDLKQMNYSEITKQAVVQQTEQLGAKIDNLTRVMKGLPIANVNIDKNGIKTFMKSGHSETEFTNRYFRN